MSQHFGQSHARQAADMFQQLDSFGRETVPADAPETGFGGQRLGTVHGIRGMQIARYLPCYNQNRFLHDLTRHPLHSRTQSMPI